MPTLATLDPLVAPAKPKAPEPKPAPATQAVAAPAAVIRATPPSVPSVRGWLEDARALITHLEARRLELADQLERATSELAAVQAALAAFEQKERAKEPQAIPLQVATVAALRWSQNYDKCIDCGLTEVKHAAKGRCHTCYSRHHRATA